MWIYIYINMDIWKKPSNFPLTSGNPTYFDIIHGQFWTSIGCMLWELRSCL